MFVQKMIKKAGCVFSVAFAVCALATGLALADNETSITVATKQYNDTAFQDTKDALDAAIGVIHDDVVAPTILHTDDISDLAQNKQTRPDYDVSQGTDSCRDGKSCLLVKSPEGAGGAVIDKWFEIITCRPFISQVLQFGHGMSTAGGEAWGGIQQTGTNTWIQAGGCGASSLGSISHCANNSTNYGSWVSQYRRDSDNGTVMGYIYGVGGWVTLDSTTLAGAEEGETVVQLGNQQIASTYSNGKNAFVCKVLGYKDGSDPESAVGDDKVLVVLKVDANTSSDWLLTDPYGRCAERFATHPVNSLYREVVCPLNPLDGAPVPQEANTDVNP